MTLDEIIRMAREAGIGCINGTLLVDIEQFSASELERFAALVAANEREACAKVCDEWYEKRGLYGVDFLAKAIRART